MGIDRKRDLRYLSIRGFLWKEESVTNREMGSKIEKMLREIISWIWSISFS